MIKCPTCLQTGCIRPAEEVLDIIYQKYLVCPDCPPEPGWDKMATLCALPFKVNRDTLRCQSCGRRPLDAVMGHILSIMIQHGDRQEHESLFDVGTPLITCGFPIMYPPRLGTDDLVLLAFNVGPETAGDIVETVPEIKGVVLRSGHQTESVGILDSDLEPHQYTLLAGCDMRCDVAQSVFGELVIYKSQSKIHIEFPRENGYKMGVLEKLDRRGLLAGRIVLDGMCGPGTLGLTSLLAGAAKVIMNDAWRPAIENVLLNIEVNSDILTLEPEIVTPIEHLPLVGDEPVLVARALRGSRIAAEIYFGDLRRLCVKVGKCDICLIDVFPSVDPADFIEACSEITSNVIVI